MMHSSNTNISHSGNTKFGSGSEPPVQKKVKVDSYNPLSPTPLNN